MRFYVETSAAAKLLVEEAASRALARFLDEAVAGADQLVSCLLLETELRRLAVRVELEQGTVTDLLERFDLLEPDRGVYRAAGLLAGRHLRSLDALHVAAALRLDASAMVTYDEGQATAALAAGLRVEMPG